MRISDWSSDGCSSDLAGDGVGGRDGDAEPGRRKEHDRAARLRAEALMGGEAGDLGAHGVDDAPAAQQRPEAHRGLARDHHPEGHVEFAAEQTLRDEIGRASCRDRVCQYVWISVVAVSLKKKTISITSI